MKDKILKITLISFSLVIFFGLIYISEYSEREIKYRTEIEALFYHNINKYTYFVYDEKKGGIISKSLPKIQSIDVVIITDVKSDDKNWIEYSYYYKGTDLDLNKEHHIRIHLKKLDDINNAKSIKILQN